MKRRVTSDEIFRRSVRSGYREKQRGLVDLGRIPTNVGAPADLSAMTLQYCHTGFVVFGGQNNGVPLVAETGGGAQGALEAVATDEDAGSHGQSVVEAIVAFGQGEIVDAVEVAPGAAPAEGTALTTTLSW